MGEKLSSVSDLIQKFGRMVNATGSANGFFWSYYSNFNTNPTLLPHMIFLADMYVLHRGSVRYAPDLGINAPIYTEINTDVGPHLGQTLRDPIGVTTPILQFGRFKSTLTCPNTMLQVPFYSQDVFYPTNGTGAFDPAVRDDFPGMYVFSRNVNVFNAYIAAGPDFMYS